MVKVCPEPSSCTGANQINKMEDRWVSISEICKHLGVSNDTVYKWIETHSMPAFRMGRLWKFKKDEVDAWVRAGGAAEPAEIEKKSRSNHKA